jgi:hypothetical protein
MVKDVWIVVVGGGFGQAVNSRWLNGCSEIDDIRSRVFMNYQHRAL